jgi:catechol 2,3-dioxygenase-like lactoylglutathione lyase family enzyme
MLKNLMYVTIYVSDQDRALAFYTENLGLEKRVDYTGPYGRFLTVAPGDESVEILLWPGNPGGGQVVDAAEPGIVPGPVFLESEDLAKEFEVLRSRGVTFVEDEPTPYEFGVRLTALDPDGNRIELRQRPRGPSSDS